MQNSTKNAYLLCKFFDKEACFVIHATFFYSKQNGLSYFNGVKFYFKEIASVSSATDQRLFLEAKSTNGSFDRQWIRGQIIASHRRGRIEVDDLKVVRVHAVNVAEAHEQLGIT